MPTPNFYTPVADMVDMTAPNAVAQLLNLHRAIFGGYRMTADPEDATPADEYVDPDTGEKYGFRPGVPIKDLSDAQQAEYWRHKSRKHEARTRAWADYEAVKAERDRLKAASMTDGDKVTAAAVAEAVAKATADTEARFRGDIVRARVESALISRNVDPTRAASLIGPLDTTYFLASDGGVDADKVSSYADGFAVGKPDPDTGQGRRGTSGPRSSVEAGRELYRDLHSKK